MEDRRRQTRLLSIIADNNITLYYTILYYTVDPMLFPSGNPFKCHEEVLYLQPLIPPKRFDIFSSLTGGCSEGLGAF